jgi:23S rRNA G2445 N2-methylase RlmL
MIGICIGYKGTEEVMQSEVEELIDAKARIEDSVVIFEIRDEKELCKLVYLGQSFCRVMLFLHSFVIKNVADVKKGDFSFLKGKKIRVDCERIGTHDFKSVDISRELGEYIYENAKCEVDFRNPEYIVYAYILNDKCYVGIDYTGFDLSKRDYKVYLHPKAVKGTIAYFMLRVAGYDKSMILLDPFCGSGTIPIEAAFFSSGFSVNSFRKEKFQFVKMRVADEKFLEKLDKKKEFKGKIYGFDKELRHINAAKQNAKIGGVEKFINFSRVDIDWLDTKFNEKEIDLIVTDAPNVTKWNEKKIAKVYEEFFHQAYFVLKEDGKIALIGSDKIKEVAEKKGFKLESELKVEKKNQIMAVDVFKKAKI